MSLYTELKNARERQERSERAQREALAKQRDAESRIRREALARFVSFSVRDCVEFLDYDENEALQISEALKRDNAAHNASDDSLDCLQRAHAYRDSRYRVTL